MAYVKEKKPRIPIPEYLILSHRSTGTPERYVSMGGLKRIITHNTQYMANGDYYIVEQNVKIYKHFGDDYVLVFDAEDNTDFTSPTSEELKVKLYSYLESI